MRKRLHPEELILEWADAHHERTGDWPSVNSGPIHTALGETWAAVNAALSQGGRSLSSGSSLAKLLAEQRGVRNMADLPPLSIEQILAWADAHQQRTGQWPNVGSGPVEDAPDETWRNIQTSLHQGLRGLTGGSSLAQLLAEKRRVRNRLDLSPVTSEQILAWADAHQKRTGKWPTKVSGQIYDASEETWAGINASLQQGKRGLLGRISLAQLLAEKRGTRNRKSLPILTHQRVLEWADAHKRRTGEWPGQSSGPIPEAPGETWAAVQSALCQGLRGLPGGSSLAALLESERGVQNRKALPPLSRVQILAWADAHRQRTGEWPRRDSGQILEAPDESWQRIDGSLADGGRGLPGSSSLRKLLAEERGDRERFVAPPLTIEQILLWADAHYNHTGQWPKQDSGPVDGTRGETWKGIQMALVKGLRQLSGGSSLVKLLKARRGLQTHYGRGPLTLDQIVAWADAHHERTGEWPRSKAGRVQDAPQETWAGVNDALMAGRRQLPGGYSLPRLLAERRGVRNKQDLPKLSIEQILGWADAFQKRTGRWPNQNAGPIEETGETWRNVDVALRQGLRGLRGGLSLASLLAEERGVRNIKELCPLNKDRIVEWMNAHYERTGEWPRLTSGPILNAPGETWAGVNWALTHGKRGLKRGLSLARLIKGTGRGAASE